MSTEPADVFLVDLFASPRDDVLVRIAGLLRRHQVRVHRLSMRERNGVLHVEAVLSGPDRRRRLACDRLRNLVDVHDVVSWRYAGTCSPHAG